MSGPDIRDIEPAYFEPAEPAEESTEAAEETVEETSETKQPARKRTAAKKTEE